jgi:3-phenylpropionate/trans-cinnamate dioxygenase ferredoxin subunit
MSNYTFVPSIKESELPVGQMKAVRVKGRAILLVRSGDEVFGVSNRCPHMGCSFERGILIGYIIECPCHGWKFDVRNGQYQENERTTLTCYRCKIQNSKVYVEIPRAKGIFGLFG